MRQRGLFQEINRLKELTDLGDPLLILNEKINWESFRNLLETIRPETNPKNKNNAGRKPFDAIMMFKVIILQRYYNISDDQMEFQLKDRRSFERFVSGGETLYEMPDAKTIWLYRERFKEAGMAEKLFEEFNGQLHEKGVIGKSGKIVDASFVEVPRQRNSREENKNIKNGKKPEDWSENKSSQKDVEARWTEKNHSKYFGYKNHISVDKKSKLILNYLSTSAEVHDSNMLLEVLGEPRKEKEIVWADSAYRSEKLENELIDSKYKSKIHERGYRNNPLTEKQMENNRMKSKVRSRVEHVFGLMYWMKADYFFYIGKKRINEAIGMANLLYNMRRFCAIG